MQNISSFISAVTRPPTVQTATPPSAAASPTTGATTPASQSFNLSSNPEFSSSSLLNDNVASHPSASQDVLKENSPSLEAPAGNKHTSAAGAHVPPGSFYSSAQTPYNSSRSANHSSPSFSKDRLVTSRRPKVLFIADAIGQNVDIRHLEEATNSLIYTESAFGANYDQAALYPDENFVCASLNAPSKRDYSSAILQGLSSDITNLENEPSNSGNLEFLKQKVFVASQNSLY